MTRYFLIAATVVVLLAPPVALLAEDPAAGWADLFNGKDLNGWVSRGGKARYHVEDKQIVGTSVPNTGNSFLCTKKEYANFILELEFKVDPALNSGVQVRSHCFDEPKTVKLNNKEIKIPAGRVHGYQVEIDPLAWAWTGGIYDEGRRGWLNDLKENEPARKAFKVLLELPVCRALSALPAFKVQPGLPAQRDRPISAAPRASW